jgi:hypothetical protein
MESQGEQEKAEFRKVRKANRDAASRYRQRKRDWEHSIELAGAQVFNENAVLREANRRLRAALPPSLLPPDSLLLHLEQRGLVSLFASSLANRIQSISACTGGGDGGRGGGGFGGACDSSGGGPAATGILAVPCMPGYYPPPPPHQQLQQQQQQLLQQHVPFFSSAATGFLAVPYMPGYPPPSPQQLQLPFFSSAGMVGSGGAGGGGLAGYQEGRVLAQGSQAIKKGSTSRWGDMCHPDSIPPHIAHRTRPTPGAHTHGLSLSSTPLTRSPRPHPAACVILETVTVATAIMSVAAAVVGVVIAAAAGTVACAEGPFQPCTSIALRQKQGKTQPEAGREGQPVNLDLPRVVRLSL